MSAPIKSAFADKKMLGRAVKDSFLKLSPRTQAQNPVMLLVYLSAILTTGLWIVSLFGLKDAPSGYTLAIAVILWFTVLFANFAEAIAEGRGKAQADSLRAAKKDVDAYKIPSADEKDRRPLRLPQERRPRPRQSGRADSRRRRSGGRRRLGGRKRHHR